MEKLNQGPCFWANIKIELFDHCNDAMSSWIMSLFLVYIFFIWLEHKAVIAVTGSEGWTERHMSP